MGRNIKHVTIKNKILENISNEYEGKCRIIKEENSNYVRDSGKIYK